MRPTMLQSSASSCEPLPNLPAHAFIQASTASACLRRLSDCVNSVSSSQASDLVLASGIVLKSPRLLLHSTTCRLRPVPASYPVVPQEKGCPTGTNFRRSCRPQCDRCSYRRLTHLYRQPPCREPYRNISRSTWSALQPCRR